MIFIGIDTSNYTTSVAAVAQDGQTWNIRKILPVKEGQRGLRQSDAVFHHVRQFPELFSDLTQQIDMSAVRGVGVSMRPRSVEGSYMPVFTAGESFARTIADALHVPLYRYSHQDGHLMAAILSADAYALLDKTFLSVHLSGGTTEILKTAFDGRSFSQEIIGGTKDISAGQLIDRVGVALGLQFPCGREIERLSASASGQVYLPVSTDGAYMNFSGAETRAMRMAQEIQPAELAKAVLETVAHTLANCLNMAVKDTGLEYILVAGGVAANQYIRDFLTQRVRAEFVFASPELSSDNAVGIAKLAQTEEIYGTENSNRIAD